MSATAGAGSTAASGAVRTAVRIDGVALDLTVDPVLVDGPAALVSVTVRPAAGTSADDLESLDLPYLWSDPHPYRSGSVSGLSGVRVLDLAAETVQRVADDGEDWALMADEEGDPDDGTPVFHRYVAVVGAPTSATVDLLLPSAGVVFDVPVRPGEAGVIERTFTELGEKPPTRIEPHRYDLTAYSTENQEAVRTTRSRGKVTVAVDSDVLFATGSAKLSSKARATLERAARALEQARPQSLQIVGHTDDVGSDADNLALSRRRARAVADRLRTLTDLSGIAVQVDGRGESQPAASGTSDLARSRNRRVELTYTADPARSAGTATPGPSSGATLPRAEGVVVSGSGPAEIIDTWDDDARYSVNVDQVRRRHGYLVGQLSVTLAEGEKDGTVTVLGSGNSASDGAFSPTLTGSVSRLTLLDGSTVVYPVQYELRAATGTNPARNYPLGDIFLMEPKAGAARTVTVVWPDLSPGAGSVTVDAAVPQWLVRTAKKGLSISRLKKDYPAFRFTDVPVTPDGS